MSTTNAPLLEVDALTVDFRTRGRVVRAVDEVTFQIAAGETLGLIGESGSGKTTIGRAVLGLTEPTRGRIALDGRDITRLSRPDRRALSKEIQVVFQDPYSSLNPSMSIGDILEEPLIVQGRSMHDARTRVRSLLDAVRLPADASRRLPREFSGGQRQRVAIARALAAEPRLVVCDEPVSGLDLKTQATVLDLLIDLQEQTNVAYLFISHDLAVVQHISHRVAVLLHGSIVETGSAREVVLRPQHQYVRRLLLASPLSDPDAQRERRRKLAEFVESTR